MTRKMLSLLLVFLFVICGVFSPVNVCAVGSGEVSEVSAVAGDVTGDLEVSIQDVLLFRKYLADSVDDGGLIIANADVTYDDKTDVRDILKIRKYLADIVVSLSKRYTVMSYNAGMWYNGSGFMVPDQQASKFLELNRGLIENNSPDILCIQEYCCNMSSQVSAAEFLSGKYKYVETAKGESQYLNYVGKAICTNERLEDADNFSLENNGVYDSPNYERAYVYLNGRRVCVVSAHFAAHPYLAMLELQGLVNTIKNEPYFIICVDANVDVKDKANYDAVMSVFESNSVECSIANGGEYGTFVTYPFADTAIDNVITSKNIKIDSVKVDDCKDELLYADGRDDRDHFPLIVSFYVD